ncbi:unnamed protein product [Effrenium voratum]|nr:unnamed protein product [Effrenium voratum]
MSQPVNDDDADDDEEPCMLDEFGWDPMVDEYLEALVDEASSQAEIDWAWVSHQFLDTLEPTPEQIEAALQRFCPDSLQQRWLYLRSTQTQVPAAPNEPPRGF